MVFFIVKGSGPCCLWHHHPNLVQLPINLFDQIVIRQGNAGELLVQLSLQGDLVDKGCYLAGHHF